MKTHLNYIVVQCEVPKKAKLVYNSNNQMVYGTYNYSYWGESLTNLHITGGPHIVVTMSFEAALLTTELFSIRISGEITRWVLTSSAWLLFWPRGTY